MTDREPGAPRPDTPRPDTTRPDRSRPDVDRRGAPGPVPATDQPTDPPGGTALRDRWWWSPTLAIVVGCVVIGYQLDALRGPNPLVLNWVVAAFGLASAVYGVVMLLRAHRAR